MLNSHLRRAGPVLLLSICGLAVVGCQQGTAVRMTHGAEVPHGRAILLDGRFNDWPAGTASLADEHFVYFRVLVEDHGMPLQAAPETVALWLDADGLADTGLLIDGPDDAADMGVDLIVEFSPPGPRGELRRGVAVYAAGDDGQRVPLSHAQIDLIAAPTHASNAYELRISRLIDREAPRTLRNALASRGEARAMFVVSDADGEILGWSEPESFVLPPVAGIPARSDVSLPERPRDALRILSWNVLDHKPLQEPAPFARIINALDPDVILLQEMWDVDETTILAWFTSVISGDVDWQVRTPPQGQGGIAIVTPHQLAPLGPDLLSLPPESRIEGDRGSDRPVRFIGASIDTPSGQLAIATVHLKCCGTSDSPEDQRRLAEARAINLELSQALGDAPMRIIAGDFNLVGSRTPLDVLVNGLDVDGSALTPAEPRVLGDAAYYTWFDPASRFSPGRLDWAVYGDAGAEVVNAFVLDGRRLSDEALAQMGIAPGDTAASDHFPLVIDIRPR